MQAGILLYLRKTLLKGIIMKQSHRKKEAFLLGLRHGFPIGLGYFAVAFSLGIAAHHAGLSAFQGFLASLLEVASAGEYAGFTAFAANATYLELGIATLIANARYLLMSFALSQRISPDLPLGHRCGMGFFITDEIFGVTIAQPGFANPFYVYGAAFASIPLWAIGTSLGIIMGTLLPVQVVSALSVSLYGMFLAIIIPPSRKNKVIGVLVVLSFLTSYLASILPYISNIAESTRIIILTILIAAIAAIVKPVEPKKEEEEHA